MQEFQAALNRTLRPHPGGAGHFAGTTLLVMRSLSTPIATTLKRCREPKIGVRKKRSRLLCDQIIFFNRPHHFINVLKYVGEAVHQLNF
jgi:hypothetical protein